MPTLHLEFFALHLDAPDEKETIAFLESSALLRKLDTIDGIKIFIEVERCPEFLGRVIHHNEILGGEFSAKDEPLYFLCTKLTKLGATIFVCTQTFLDAHIFIPMKNIVSISTDGPEYFTKGIQAWRLRQETRVNNPERVLTLKSHSNR